MNKADAIYQKVTDLIVEKLEAGTKAWNKPFSAPGILPMNLTTQKAYRGFNSLFLSSLGYESPYFLTFNQVKKLGGSVVQGQKSYPIVFWKFVNKVGKDEPTDEPVRKSFPILKYYNVFNLEQTTGIDEKHIPEIVVYEHDSIPEAEQLVANYPNPPQITHGADGACYISALDRVMMPDKETFKTEFYYYSVMFHELGHSTGHNDRLNRPLGNIFGSHAYSFEELVAEMTAAFLCGSCGFEAETIDNSAAYLNGWAGALKKNPNWLIQAAGKAQKAADHILGITQSYENEDKKKENEKVAA